jgi:hypothetical protein
VRRCDLFAVSLDREDVRVVAISVELQVPGADHRLEGCFAASTDGFEQIFQRQELLIVRPHGPLARYLAAELSAGDIDSTGTDGDTVGSGDCVHVETYSSVGQDCPGPAGAGFGGLLGLSSGMNLLRMGEVAAVIRADEKTCPCVDVIAIDPIPAGAMVAPVHTGDQRIDLPVSVCGMPDFWIDVGGQAVQPDLCIPSPELDAYRHCSKSPHAGGTPATRAQYRATWFR